jgi:hypothetical protein
MSSNIVVAGFETGFETDKPPFQINNDAFPILNNSYIWRSRVLKKRGSQQIGRLTRALSNLSLGTSPATLQWSFFIYNVITPAIINQPNKQIKPGSVTITDGVDTFVDQGNATLKRLSDGALNNAINYATGAVLLNRTVATANAFTISMSYYPCLPVVGIRDYNINFNTPGNVNFPVTVWFDPLYSYQFNQTTSTFYNVNFFASSGTPFVWSGADWQLFWTVNYQGAMWATNNVPGFNKATIATITVGNPTTIVTTAANPLVTGDQVFINEVTGADAALLNLQTFTITRVNATTFTIPIDTTGKAINSIGIVQLLTNTISGQDGIKYYLGDPTGDLTRGWVNFAPPLSNSATPSYLVGAKLIIPFKNRLLFFGTWTQTSAAASPTYNPNQLVACQNGTVFVTSPVPPNQVVDPTSFYQNVVGKGLRLNAPISQEIISANLNHDVIIVDFETLPLKLYSTGDDSAPFLYQDISSEFGGQSTFSTVALDAGVMGIGPYGFKMTTQVSSQRIDLQIPDQVFNINKDNHGSNRVISVRDYRNEFIYWTFPTNGNFVNNVSQINWTYPTTTLAFNYRENLWSTFTENFTAYGSFRYGTFNTWATIGQKFSSWRAWNVPWNFGGTQTRFAYICAGNQQGFVFIKTESTAEPQSQYISNIGATTIFSPSHNLNDGDYVLFQGLQGTGAIPAMNGLIYKIQVRAIQPDFFVILPTEPQPIPDVGDVYTGGGTYSRLTNVIIQTKQFPVYWGQSRKVRIGTQYYLFQTTQAGQVTINLFTSQSNTLPANSPIYSPYIPYTNILQTCAEGGDLNVIQGDQDQIWHQMNTSVQGDTVQVGITLSDAQMRDPNVNQAEITLYGFAIKTYPGAALTY